MLNHSFSEETFPNIISSCRRFWPFLTNNNLAAVCVHMSSLACTIAIVPLVWIQNWTKRLQIMHLVSFLYASCSGKPMLRSLYQLDIFGWQLSVLPSLNFHMNLWNELQLKSSLIPGVDHKTKGGAFDEKGWQVPHFKTLNKERTRWIQTVCLKKYCGAFVLHEVSLWKALWELQYPQRFPPALPDQPTNTLQVEFGFKDRSLWGNSLEATMLDFRQKTAMTRISYMANCKMVRLDKKTICHLKEHLTVISLKCTTDKK